MKFKFKKSSTANTELENSLVIARAEYLRSNLYVANVGTTSIILVLCYFFWGEDLKFDLYEWVAVGSISSLFRLALMLHYRAPNCFEDEPGIAKKYLYLHTCATILAGIAFGYGWLSLIPHLSAFEQIIYLLSIVALLFGGLFAYSPFFPAYLGFSSMALWISPLLLDFTREIYITGLAFGIGLISLVSTMFAYRFSETFKTSRELQFNVYKLLSEVTQKRDEAVAANLAKTRFLASVSHDLRQPMQAVSLSLNTLQQLIVHKAGRENNQRLVEDNLAGLHHSVHYLNSMFEALLDISRLDAGALNVNIDFQEIQSLFKGLEFEFSKIAQQEGLHFEIAIPEHFDKYRVRADLNILQRLLRNLITNAVRYTPRGGIRLAARIRGRQIDIRVIDTGMGIPIGMRTKIFDEFFQLRNPLAKDKNVGMGLGLSIARRLSGILGANIRLYSREGKGSVFAFKLPLKSSSTAMESVPQSIQTHHAADAVQGAFIVVIDDDPKICNATKAMLELHGAEVITAESGDSAVAQMIFSNRLPNLILSDYRLVGETGIECIEKIRNEFNEDIPAIIVTGDTAPDELNLLCAAGMDILYKPVPAEALLLAIGNNLRKTKF